MSMKKVIKILAGYSIVIASYSIAVNFLAVGREIRVTSGVALITLLTFLPIMIFSILVFVHLKD